MSLFGGKTKLEATAVIFLFIMFLFQIWVGSDYRAEAIRIFPEPTKLINKATNFSATSSMKKKSFKQDLFHKYFHGSAFHFNTTTTTTLRDDKGFEEDKRRVPSCPDPLHN
ncbi:hypothetical protein Pint_21957 [Pistacia integerrima]|uniref:Uncharacterized protein n=1 Tax=Pistacia integerrima TaxID=434235 RepID=A0ACC0YLF8_9ROSI|nr:hypothetical protein Pint_21957 [Pistacia integerrima]